MAPSFDDEGQSVDMIHVLQRPFSKPLFQQAVETCLVQLAVGAALRRPGEGRLAAADQAALLQRCVPRVLPPGRRALVHRHLRATQAYLQPISMVESRLTLQHCMEARGYFAFRNPYIEQCLATL